MNLYKQNKNDNSLINLKQIPIIKKRINRSLFKRPINDDNDNKRLYINIESNIFTDKYNNNTKNNIKKYNLKNYKNIINNRRKYNSASYEEQNEVNIITCFFDSLELRKIKKDFLKNKTHLLFGINDMRAKNVIKNNKYNCTTNTNRRKIINIPKREFNTTVNNYCRTFEKKPKIKNNKEMGLPDIKTVKSNFKNLLLKVKELNIHLEKNNINRKYEKKNKLKNDNNNILYDKNNKQGNMTNIDESINIINNKKYLNQYMEKLCNYKYKNKKINSFFKEKENQIKKSKTDNFIMPINNENENGLEDYNKNIIIQKKIINQIKELKYKVKSNVDKDIFKIFNKNS